MGLVEVSETFLMIYVHCENEGGNARNAYLGPHQPGEAPSLTSIFISLFISPNQNNFLGLLVSIGLVDHVHDGSGRLWTTRTAAGLRAWPIYRDISVYCPISES